MAILHYEIPVDLHRALKMEAARLGMTLKALIISLLEQAMDERR